MDISIWTSIAECTEADQVPTNSANRRLIVSVSHGSRAWGSVFDLLCIALGRDHHLVDEGEQRQSSSPRPSRARNVPCHTYRSAARLVNERCRGETEHASRSTSTSGAAIFPRARMHIDSQPKDHTSHRGAKNSTEK